MVRCAAKSRQDGGERVPHLINKAASMISQQFVRARKGSMRMVARAPGGPTASDEPLVCPQCGGNAWLSFVSVNESHVYFTMCHNCHLIVRPCKVPSRLINKK